MSMLFDGVGLQAKQQLPNSKEGYWHLKFGSIRIKLEAKATMNQMEVCSPEDTS
jgi:hypothetical protein